MNIYIILAIAYLVYTIYNRYKATAANRPTIQKQTSEREAPKQQESLMDRLRRMAEEMQEQERKAQEQARGQFNTPDAEAERNEEWVVTETGTTVHDLEGRRIKEEYLRSKEENAVRELSLREEYRANHEFAKSLEASAVADYESASSKGQYRHGKKIAPTFSPKKAGARTMERRKNIHPLSKSLFGPGAAKRAMIIKEIFERPEY